MNQRLRLATLCLSSAAGVALAIYVARASTPVSEVEPPPSLASTPEPAAPVADPQEAASIEDAVGQQHTDDNLLRPRATDSAGQTSVESGLGEPATLQGKRPWDDSASAPQESSTLRLATRRPDDERAPEQTTLLDVVATVEPSPVAVAQLPQQPPVPQPVQQPGPPPVAQQPPTQQPVPHPVQPLAQHVIQRPPVEHPPVQPSPVQPSPALPIQQYVAQQPPAQQPPVQHPLPPPAATLDVAEGDDHLELYAQNADIREVLALLGKQANLNIVASNAVQGNVSVSLNLRDVDVETALGAVLRSTGLMARREGEFLYVSTPAEFATRDRLYDPIGVRVYRPNYTTASELSNLLTPFITPAAGKISVTSRAQSGIQPNDNEAGGDDLAGGDVIVVQDHESVLLKIDQVFREIDCRPLQVAIEAMILSVDLDDTNKLGVDFSFLSNNGHVRFTLGSPVTDLANVSVENGGLKFAFLDGHTGAFIEALETIGDTNVIATPRLMALNKQRAEILIGAQLGYVNTTVTETTATQSVEFLEVGTQLRLRPFISRDGLIRMEVHPELSTGKVTVEDGLTLPDKQVTKVTTNIMVRDGCTMIIGGLMREDLITTGKQIPWLGSLPVVGAVFRHLDEKTQRREILVLVTPHIVYDEQACCEGDRAAAEFHRRQAIYADKMSPLGKRYMGRKQFHLAQEAWAVGNRELALKHANLAIHYDPLNRAAIDLRSDIVAGIPFGDHTLYGAPLPVDGMIPMDGGAAVPAPVSQSTIHHQPATPQPPAGPASPENFGPQPQPGRAP